jgi:hypothetical protein
MLCLDAHLMQTRTAATGRDSRLQARLIGVKPQGKGVIGNKVRHC